MTEQEFIALCDEIYYEMRNDEDLEDAWMDARDIAREAIVRTIGKMLARG